MTELWIQTALGPVKEVAAQARRLEGDGWAGVMPPPPLKGDPQAAYENTVRHVLPAFAG